jgi:hypothetical protein
MDAEEDPNLYEEASQSLSPIEREAASAVSLPPVHSF